MLSQRDYKIGGIQNIHSGLTLKVVLLGDGAVGKTSLAHRLAHDVATTQYKPTNGLDFYEKNVIIPGAPPSKSPIRLQVWDISGAALRTRMALNYLFQADAILLMYDIAHCGSFNNVENWLKLVYKCYLGEHITEMSSKATSVVLQDAMTFRSTFYEKARLELPDFYNNAGDIHMFRRLSMNAAALAASGGGALVGPGGRRQSMSVNAAKLAEIQKAKNASNRRKSIAPTSAADALLSLAKVKESAPVHEKLPYMALVGNKIDLIAMRSVRQEKHTALAQDNKLNSYFVSTKTGEGIMPMFVALVSDILRINPKRLELEGKNAAEKGGAGDKDDDGTGKGGDAAGGKRNARRAVDPRASGCVVM